MRPGTQMEGRDLMRNAFYHRAADKYENHSKIHVTIFPIACLSHAQTPPSHEEKGFGDY